MVGRRAVERFGAVSLAAITAVAACGSSEKKTAPSAYVSQVCTAIGGLLRTVQTDAAALSSEVHRSRGTAERKAALSHLLSSALQAADQAVSGLKAAGVPDVAEGRQISRRLVGAFEEVRSVLINDQRRASLLNTGSARAFGEESRQLGRDLENSLSSVGGSLSQLHSAKLDQAAASSPACQALVGSSAGSSS